MTKRKNGHRRGQSTSALLKALGQVYMEALAVKEEKDQQRHEQMVTSNNHFRQVILAERDEWKRNLPQTIAKAVAAAITQHESRCRMKLPRKEGTPC